MRLTALLLALTLSAAPLWAQDRQAVFDALHATHGGVLQGETYAGDTSSQTSQYWRCQTCGGRERLVIGYYDYAETYATTDPAEVLRMVTAACGMDGCRTMSYDHLGFMGIRQEGTRRNLYRVRTALIAGDRMIMLEARDYSSYDAALAVHAEAEALLIRPLLEALP